MPRAQKPCKGLSDTWGRRNRTLPDQHCPQCGNIFRPKSKRSKYCSRACAWINNGGHNKKQETWWTNSHGYREGRIWLSEGIQIRVKEHRFIMAGILGRSLHPWEDVHHLDGNKSNNAIENLLLISHGDHSRQTNSEREYKRGYKLKITPAERKSRSLKAIALDLSRLGRAALAKARGEKEKGK